MVACLTESHSLEDFFATKARKKSSFQIVAG